MISLAQRSEEGRNLHLSSVRPYAERNLNGLGFSIIQKDAEKKKSCCPSGVYVTRVKNCRTMEVIVDVIDINSNLSLEPHEIVMYYQFWKFEMKVHIL